MTLLDERLTNPLHPEGVSVLLVYGAKLHPPTAATPSTPARPGIRVTVDPHGTCLLEAVGYPDDAAANVAICAAAQTCLDAELVVSFTPTWMNVKHARIVRRRSK